MKYLYIIIFLGVLGLTTAVAQDCTLGVGYADNTTLGSVFQLNEQQKELLAQFSTASRIANKELEAKAFDLRENHPQKTPDQLLLFNQKYDSIKLQMAQQATLFDKKLITIFNEKQYARYQQLCAEVKRIPLQRLVE